MASIVASVLQFFLNVFAYFANYVISKLGARYGIRLALVAFWLSAVAVLTASVNTILAALTSELHPVVQTALGILPSNTVACIAAIQSCRAACWLYISGVYVASVKARV